MRYTFGTICGNIDELHTALQKKTWYGRKIQYNLQERINRYAKEAALKVSGGSGLHVDIVAIAGSLDAIQREFYGKVLYDNEESFISFSRRTIYVNTKMVTKHVLKHEFGHALFQNILGSKRVPSDLHEVIANYAMVD